MLELILGLTLLLFAFLQAVFLGMAEERRCLWFLRWVSLAAVLLLFVTAWQFWNDSSPFFPGLNGLGVLIFGLLGLCALLGWGLGWGVFALWKRRKR